LPSFVVDADNQLIMQSLFQERAELAISGQGTLRIDELRHYFLLLPVTLGENDAFSSYADGLLVKLLQNLL
jgi:hypothetical protein